VTTIYYFLLSGRSFLIIDLLEKCKYLKILSDTSRFHVEVGFEENRIFNKIKKSRI